VRSRALRWAFNWYPVYRGSGGRIRYMADDHKEIRVDVPLSWRTRNYVGTIYGGSMYGAIDPIYMLMLMWTLGPGYVVWDKAATIRFQKPGRTTLHARFLLTDEELAAIKAALESAESVDRVYVVELEDDAGLVHATIEKTIWIAKKKPRPAR
jgi:hypothetical protein